MCSKLSTISLRFYTGSIYLINMVVKTKAIYQNPEQMWENLGIDKEGYECMLLVGNNNKYRTSFMVISILPIVMKTEMKGKAFPDFQSTLLQYGDGTELRSSHSTRV